MQFKCTYRDCHESFETEKAMKYHKKFSDEHDYCHKCDEDFDCFDDYTHHKITRPEEHGKACRVCGDEFKSESGLKRHIELNHKVDQRLACIGCHKTFYRACLFIEHLEFGHCQVITASQFQGHVVHKHLITEFLKGDLAYERFMQKTSKFDAAQDFEEEGGIELDGPLDQGVEEVGFKALKPDTTSSMTFTQSSEDELYPPLSSQHGATGSSSFDVASTLDRMSLNQKTILSTVAGSSDPPISSSTNLQLKVWKSRPGQSASKILFPYAKPTPAPKEFSIMAHDRAMEQNHGINIMQTRFWDPISSDWNPEKFYDSIMNKYACPFICEQMFECAGDLSDHILNDHRVTRMRCPLCMKNFRSATALMAHCESRGAKCPVNKADDFNMFLDRLSGGFLGVQEAIRPDHQNNPTTMLTNPETGRMEVYKPPVASYLEYMVTKPPDWKEPVRPAAVIGGFPKEQSTRW